MYYFSQHLNYALWSLIFVALCRIYIDLTEYMENCVFDDFQMLGIITSIQMRGSAIEQRSIKKLVGIMDEEMRRFPSLVKFINQKQTETSSNGAHVVYAPKDPRNSEQSIHGQKFWPSLMFFLFAFFPISTFVYWFLLTFSYHFNKNPTKTYQMTQNKYVWIFC